QHDDHLIKSFESFGQSKLTCDAKLALSDEVKPDNILDWINESFLCVQIAQSEPENSIHRETFEKMLNKIDNENVVDLQLINFRQPSDIVEATDEDSSKFSTARHARIRFEAGELLIQAGSLDFVANVVRQLVIGYLGLGNFDCESTIPAPITSKLAATTAKVSELHDTNTRIQVEFASTSNYLSSLANQLLLSCSLHQYKIAMDILFDMNQMQTDLANLSEARLSNHFESIQAKRECNELFDKTALLTSHRTIL
ncbi:hypothetical protein GZH46_00843, partial [Fragariocoptes setiger]